jgi:hypothetical protein
VRAAGLLALLALVTLTGCAGPAATPQVILVGHLDLDVAAGDELKKECPSEAPGAAQSGMIACILGPAKDAFAPYEKQLKAKSWSSRDSQTWTGPLDAEGMPRCLVVRSFTSTFTRRERTVLEFELVDPAVGCPAGGGAHA